MSNPDVSWWRMAIVAALLLAPAAGRTQIEFPRENPPAHVAQRAGLTDISVDYASPAAKGRRIWGNVVPYGRVWTLGGYQAPRVRFSRAVTVGGKSVAAGSYWLFAIPQKDEWTFALARAEGTQDAGRELRAEQEVARVRVRPRAAAARERLTIDFPSFSDDQATLELAWDKLAIDLPIGLETTHQIDASIAGLDTTWRTYADLARYMLEAKHDYAAGLHYVDQSLALHEDWTNLWVKALLLAAQGDTKGAQQQGERARELGVKSGDPLFPQAELQKAVAGWSAKNVAAR